MAPSSDKQGSKFKNSRLGMGSFLKKGDAIEGRKELQEPLDVPEEILSQLNSGLLKRERILLMKVLAGDTLCVYIYKFAN